jgi:plasmid stabilization system protein ParE
MTYEVVMTGRAERDLRAAAEWIAASAPEAALRWLDGFRKAIGRLQSNPEMCGYARENGVFPLELRQLAYGHKRNYRAIFTIREAQVVVLAIRHAARADLEPGDL